MKYVFIIATLAFGVVGTMFLYTNKNEESKNEESIKEESSDESHEVEIDTMDFEYDEEIN